MATGADFDRNVDYLRDVQYRDSTELAKRANLHVAYRTAPQLAFVAAADGVFRVSKDTGALIARRPR